MNAMEAIEVGQDFPFFRVENDQLVCVHVGDVEPTVRRIQALIIEAHGRAGQRYVRDGAEPPLVRIRGRVAIRGSKEGGNGADAYNKEKK